MPNAKHRRGSTVISKHFRELKDLWGGIVSYVLGLVVALNETGFRTVTSCEGHADYRHPTPCIAIRAVPGDAKPETKWAVQAATHVQLRKLIAAFTKGCKKGAHLALIQESRFDFITLVAGKADYLGSIHRIARANRMSNLKLVLTPNELTHRQTILPKFHEEIAAFEKFLKKNKNSVI